MSGHSKWAKIKRQKGANDAKRGALFTKLAKVITLAASEAGGDPASNFALRLAIDKAKRVNMTTDNIDRAIKRGTGESGEAKIQKVAYEGVGPEASAFVIICNTDNTNRTVAEIRKIFESHGATLGSAGNVMWQFDEIGLVTIKPFEKKKSEVFGKEDTYIPLDEDMLELDLIDQSGVIDISKTQEDEIEIKVEKPSFSSLNKYLESRNIQLISSDLIYDPKDQIKLSEESQVKVLNLMEALDDHDDVENIFTNVNLD